MGSPLYVVLVELLASIMSTPLYSWGDGGPETEGGACAIARRWWVMGKEWRLSVVWYPRHLHSPPHLAWWPQELRNWDFTEVKMVLPVKSTVWSTRQLGTRQMEPSLLALSPPRSLSSETSWVRIIEFVIFKDPVLSHDHIPVSGICFLAGSSKPQSSLVMWAADVTASPSWWMIFLNVFWGV